MANENELEIPEQLFDRFAKDYPDKSIITLGNGKQLAMTPYLFATLRELNPTGKTVLIWYKNAKKRKRIVFRLTARQVENKVKTSATSRIANLDPLIAALMATIWEDIDDVLSHDEMVRKAEWRLDEAFRRGEGWFTKY